MSTTLKRTSMALDSETIDDLEYLSELWQTSKAEVIRRVIKKEKQHYSTIPKLTVEERIKLLEKLKTNPILNKQQAKLALDDLKLTREAMADRDPWKDHTEHAH